MTKLTDKLRNLLSIYDAKFSKQEAKFADAKLSDGVTVLRLPNDMPVKGDAITVITEQGELPLPDNAPDEPYVLEDGTIFTVVNGAVDTVTEAETPEEDVKEKGAEAPVAAPAMAAEPAKTAPKRVIKSQVEEHVFNSAIADLKMLIDFQNENIKSLTEKINSQMEFNKELATTIELIADEPGAESAEAKKKLVKKSFEEMTELERYRESKKLWR